MTGIGACPETDAAETARLMGYATDKKRYGTDATRRRDGIGSDQIKPTSWNLASTISLSNGFMMYSLAPACRARAMCATSVSVVQNTTFGRSPPGMRRNALSKA